MTPPQSHSGPVHVVQVGTDTSLLDHRAASDTLARQRLYGELLASGRPGSSNTIVVLGAPSSAAPVEIDNVRIVPVAGRWRGLVSLLRVLRELHATRPISVIAAQSVHEEAWACLRFARRRGIPVVAQLHFDLFSSEALPGGTVARRALGRLRHRLALRRLPLFAGVRAVTRDLAIRAETAGARNVTSIPVPILDLAELARVPLGRDQPRVLFVGRLAPEKNLPLWLAAARRILAARPDARFDIAGGGALSAPLAAEAMRLGLGPALTFHGPVPRDRIPTLYRQASVLLLSSRHEGFGRVLVEAMASGVPVVATRTAGALDVTEDGVYGTLAGLDDADGLARAVLALLDDPAAAARIAVAARRRVSARFDAAVLARQWMDMLIEAADRGHPV